MSRPRPRVHRPDCSAGRSHTSAERNAADWSGQLQFDRMGRPPSPIACGWPCFSGFFQLYPLKAFNYLLPSVPALCLLAARAIERLSLPRLSVLRVAATAVVAVLVAGGVVTHQWQALHDDSDAGLEEASRWLAVNSPPAAG
jgi:hypothetical protein